MTTEYKHPLQGLEFEDQVPVYSIYRNSILKALQELKQINPRRGALPYDERKFMVQYYELLRSVLHLALADHNELPVVNRNFLINMTEKSLSHYKDDNTAARARTIRCLSEWYPYGLIWEKSYGDTASWEGTK